MALQGTALDASAKKLHAVTKGYYHDSFIGLFCNDTTQMNAPLMNRGQWIRVKAVEYAVSRFATVCYPGQKIQVVSIGCGVDTLFFRYVENGRTLDGAVASSASSSSTGGGSAQQQQSNQQQKFEIAKFLELDVESMVDYKQKKMKKHSDVFTPLLTSGGMDGVYQLHACDLRDQEAMKKMLETHLDTSLPTIFIAECVFVYFRSSVTTSLLKTIAHDVFKHQPHVAVLSYDAIGPNDRFGQTMLQNLAERGIELAGIHDLPSKEAHQARLETEVGFKQVKAYTMGSLHNLIPIDIRSNHLNRVEMIDDWDEWNIVMGHYVVVFAIYGAAEEGKNASGGEAAAGSSSPTISSTPKLPTIFPADDLASIQRAKLPAVGRKGLPLVD